TFTQTSKLATIVSITACGRDGARASSRDIRRTSMPPYKAPVADTLFVLNDVLGYDRYSNLPGFGDATPDALEAMRDAAAQLAETVLHPLNRWGATEGCVRNADGSVTTPKGFKEAYDQYRGGGWMALSIPAEYGGQGLPYTVHSAVGEYMSSA